MTFEMIWVPEANAFIGRTEVTWEEFETFYLTDETESGADAVTRPTPSYHPHDRGWGRGKRPATGISGLAARNYCEWLSKKTGRTYRLPTEKEWEAACADSKPGWTKANAGEKTHEVAQKAPNRHGLHDMVGNVWEFCGDGTIVRGGSWADESPTAASRRKVPEEWNESDPQRPRSEWWLADAPFSGFRLAAPPPARSGN